MDKKEKIVTITIMGLIILIAGITCNFVVVDHNEGRMPVPFSYAYKTESHISFSEKSEINNYYLADIFNIKNLYFSIGDILIALGIIIALGSYGNRLYIAVKEKNL